MWQELISLTETLDFEENGGIGVVGAHVHWPHKTQELQLDLEVATGQGDAGLKDIQKWRLVCHSARAHKLALGWSDTLEVTQDHVLL